VAAPWSSSRAIDRHSNRSANIRCRNGIDGAKLGIFVPRLARAAVERMATEILNGIRDSM